MGEGEGAASIKINTFTQLIWVNILYQSNSYRADEITFRWQFHQINSVQLLSPTKYSSYESSKESFSLALFILQDNLFIKRLLIGQPPAWDATVTGIGGFQMATNGRRRARNVEDWSRRDKSCICDAEGVAGWDRVGGKMLPWWELKRRNKSPTKKEKKVSHEVSTW